MDFATFEQALRVADYLQLELGKDYLVFPLPVNTAQSLMVLFTGHGLLVLELAWTPTLDGVLSHFDTTTCSVVK